MAKYAIYGEQANPCVMLLLLIQKRTMGKN